MKTIINWITKGEENAGISIVIACGLLIVLLSAVC